MFSFDSICISQSHLCCCFSIILHHFQALFDSIYCTMQFPFPTPSGQMCALHQIFSIFDLKFSQQIEAKWISKKKVFFFTSWWSVHLNEFHRCNATLFLLLLTVVVMMVILFFCSTFCISSFHKSVMAYCLLENYTYMVFGFSLLVFPFLPLSFPPHPNFDMLVASINK